MRPLALVAAASLFVASLGGATSPQRAFVSVDGNDANAATGCTLASPCRSFGTAIGAVATNGEVIALDSGGYGRFSVTKSITVTAPPGVYAGISVFSGTNGVDINTAGVNVILRGLTINGQGGTHGIYFQSGASLVVENCTIGSMSGSAIHVSAAGASNAFPSQTSVIGTTITHGSVGVHIGEGPASVTIARSSLAGNDIAVDAHGTTNGIENEVAVDDTVIANNNNGVLARGDVSGATIVAVVNGSTLIENGSNGIYATGVAGATTLVTATGNTISRNFNGVTADGPGSTTITVGHNTISRNRQIGLGQFASATVNTRGDNTVNDNPTNLFGSPTSLPGI